MKNFWLISLYVGLFLSACSSTPVPVSEKMRIVVDDFERNGAHCSQEQLAVYEMQYNNLLLELEQTQATMTEEEMKLVAKEIARYNGLQMRYNINATVEGAKNIYMLLPTITEGFLEGFNAEEGIENLQLKFKEMLDETVRASEQIKSGEKTLQHFQQSIENMIEEAEVAEEKIDSILHN